MKKLLALILSLVMLCSLTIPVFAAEPVTPTAPEWINEKDYIIFPDDEVYQPENWAKVLELRTDAVNGALLPTEGYTWAEGSAGMQYEIGLVRLKYAENAGVTTKEGRLAFYSAGRAFAAAASSWCNTYFEEPDTLYFQIELCEMRAYLLYRYDYVARSLPRTLHAILFRLDMTLNDFYDAPHMELVPEEDRAKIVNDLYAYQSRIEIKIDGSALYADVKPESRNDRTMVPIRAVAEALGATVGWDEDTQQVTLERAGTTIVMTIGSTTAAVNGEEILMDVAPYVSNDRTFIPVRYVAEFFGQKVDWDETYRTVVVTEDKSAAGDSNLEDWALPMGAMISCLTSNADVDRFGLFPRSKRLAYSSSDGSGIALPGGVHYTNMFPSELCRRTLSSSWGVNSREALAYTVLSMTYYGHNATFLEMAADVKLRAEEERAEISASSNVWPAYMWTYTEYLDEKWGDRGILAWDLFRMSNLVQWGYTAGYVTYEEALTLLQPAAALLCANFSSWDEAYENYLDGYNWWARLNVLDQDIWETPRGLLYTSLKSDPKLGRIFDDSLFETGVIPLPTAE